MTATKTTKASKTTKSKAPKATNAASKKTAPAAPAKTMSALDAAAKVLAEAGQPMNAKAMIEAMATQGYWTSPGGKRPHATLYAAVLREIGVKGDTSRFRRTTKGHFEVAGLAKVTPIPKAKHAKSLAKVTPAKPTIADETGSKA